jgi:aldose 1-epimerase
MGVAAEPWGLGGDGRAATLYRLSNAHGMTVVVSDWGGLIVAIEVPDRAGRIGNVVLGYPRLADYLARPDGAHLGAPIGRFANRISNARFLIDGADVRLRANDGPHALHSGGGGYDERRWAAMPTDDGVTLSLTSPAGDQGMPGTLALEMRYTVTEANELRIDYVATTDAPTAINLTNHSYFNLAGGGDVLDHGVEIASDRIADARADGISTGRFVPVAGGYDLRQPRAIRQAIDEEHVLRAANGFDTSYVLSDTPRANPTFAARVTEPNSGRSLEILTTEPSLQFYTGNHLSARDGFARHAGLAIEPQHLPDSVNRPEFPTTVLRPGATFRSTTTYRFGIFD